MSKYINRRDFIKGAGAAWVLMQSPSVFATAKLLSESTKKPLVWVMLRGGLDPLHTIMPVADPDFAAIRGAIVKPIEDALLPLNQSFSLHPDLPYLHQLYGEGQLSPIVAVATGYRERSHFEAQDQLESGLNQTEHENGWLARALNAYSGDGLALARAVPIALRGEDNTVQTWYPTAFNEPDDDLLARLTSLYSNDEQMGEWLDLAKMQLTATQGMEQKRRTNFALLAKSCGQLMAQQANISCAMLELNGWDTHNNMQGRLSRKFRELDAGLLALRESLGERWKDTLVVVTTEFGRTVAINGTSGSDHGTGASMFLAGGALASNAPDFASAGVANKQVHGSWPGLGKDQLYEGRDLMPTSDTREWIGKALKAHWSLNKRQLAEIFPDISFM
ncbi:DUF1501 domain-containing protein [Glaciecola sp. SC05]|uniref:DUF1501 domain-containing protein n=1 Tax=Glaciecola sp. SC05 TaxID=1987355 RepID=UPI003528F106